MNDQQLVPKKEELLTVLEQGGIESAMKPLIREIHLFDTFISGTARLQDPAPLFKAAVGDTLVLRREENRFDTNAILVLNGAEEKIGYIPEKDNAIFARLMDAGKMLSAKIAKIDRKGSFTQITIGIYLTDF